MGNEWGAMLDPGGHVGSWRQLQLAALEESAGFSCECFQTPFGCDFVD